MRFGRRRFIHLFTATAMAAWPACAQAAPRRSVLDGLFGRRGEPAVPSIRYITPEGAGARDGRSWESAARLTDLSALIRDAGPGGKVLLAADRGRYTIDDWIEVEHGGAAGQPVLVQGANSDGADAIAEIWGDRKDPFRPSEEEGTECFHFTRGADHLHFRNFHFRNVGNGCFRVGAPIEDLTIEDCTFRNVYRFLENTTTGDLEDATMHTFAVRRCSGSGLERSFARIRYQSNDGLIEDCRADSEANMGDPFAVGCALDDAAHHITYRRCVMENFRQDKGPGRYWNGDGFSDEEGNHDIRYEYCEARGSTDGGFDCKSDNLVLDHCVSEDNKRNIRLWSPHSTLIACTSRNPNWRGAPDENGGPGHFWLGGPAHPASRIRDLIIEDDEPNPVFVVEGDGVRVQILGYALACHDDAKLIDGDQDANPSIAFVPETAAPANRRPPSIAGETTVGGTLHAQKGLWAAKPRPTYVYQWRRNGAPIAGATRESYATTAADRGAAISVSVSASNSAGGAEAHSPAISIS